MWRQGVCLGEVKLLPRRKHTTFRTQRKFEIKKAYFWLSLTNSCTSLFAIACICTDKCHLCRISAVYKESSNLLLTFSQIQFCFVTIIPKNSLPHFLRTYRLSSQYFESTLHFNDKIWTYSSGWFISIAIFMGVAFCSQN